MAWSRTAAPPDTSQANTAITTSTSPGLSQITTITVRSYWGRTEVALKSPHSVLTSKDGRWCSKIQGVRELNLIDHCETANYWYGATDRQPTLTASILISILEIYFVAQIRMFFFSSEILILLIWSDNFHTIQHMEMVMLTLTQIFHNNNREKRNCWETWKTLLIFIVCIDLN